VLIDSPRYVAKLVEAFERMGGLTDVLLSHQDDVADADKYADRFSARVWIHDDDRSAAPYATNVLKGTEMTDIGGNLIAIPAPGHTRGSVVYLWRDTYLFSGDSLAWSRETHDLIAFREACWYSWSELKRSLGRLGEYQFEWILPGHGHSVHLPAAEMSARLGALVDRM
jgi:glyoxylase-like metal-dependent hydrolase (beta-lactamase superfamily II)